MKSATAISYELDDIAAAAKELTAQIRDKLTFGKHTVAILHGQPDMEIGELSAAISRELGCHVIGGTTAAGAMLSNEGYHELSLILHVLSDDDCLFGAAISGSVSDKPALDIKDTYQKAYGELKNQDAAAEPKLVICVAPLTAADVLVETVSELCGNIPVFGYIAGDDFEFSKQQVFFDGEAGGDRMAILLLSGDIRPIFQTANLAGKKSLEKKLVTKARNNIICEIEGKPAYEYIKEFPFINDETTVLFNYQFFVEMPNDDNDGIPVSRALSAYDKETGEITCFANVPEGAYIGLLYCVGADVSNTAEAGLKDFLAKANAAGDGYEYSTALVVTCSLRNMFLADMKAAEGDHIKDLIPQSIALSGLHGFGEIAPTSVSDNKAVNRFHNATFTICAF
ncbi:MAG: FIST C-terminal domain-containing protein [Oscillospiraceae bacterium]|nr:FIST C-terminal domain-containing protein [Oscillospiraceae bacterium]